MVEDLEEEVDMMCVQPPECGSRPLSRRKNVRLVLSERLKYRAGLSSQRIRRCSKQLSFTPSRDFNRNISDTTVPLDDCFLHFNSSIPSHHSTPCNPSAFSDSSLLDKTNSTNQLDRYNVLDKEGEGGLKEMAYLCSSNSTTNTLHSVNSVNPVSSGPVSTGGGAKLVSNEIKRLGRLEPVQNIESFVQVNFSNYRQFYDRVGPIRLSSPISEGLSSTHVSVALWNDPASQLISQNSSKRKVYNVFWLPKIFSNVALRAAIKLVEDCNVRDGRSIKREIECHLYMYQRFQALAKSGSQSLILQDDWPTVEVLGYFLDKRDPGQSVLVSRKLTGPDFFYIIRSESSAGFSRRVTPIYEFNKLDWCITALNRVAQFASVGVRHNDIKPDNIVLDVYFDQGVKKVDVKIIDLGIFTQ